MSIRDVLLWPDPRLSKVCAPLPSPDAALITDLFDTLYHAYGRGLAAPQIGVLSRAFVVDVTWKEGTYTPRAFINPVVRSASDEVWIHDEQCLSIPDLPMPVERPQTITLEWSDLDGTRQTGDFQGVEARCILHELDHLDGRVILDHQDPDARADLEARYAR